MIKTLLRFIAATALTTVAAAPAFAAPYVLNYSGTVRGATTSFTTVLNLDLSSNGAVATFVSGTRNGIAITGISSYAGADNRLSFVDPFVSLGGLSYTVTGGTSYNFFYDRDGSYVLPLGTAGYGETNSVIDPSGSVGALANRVTFASVNGVAITPSVPEPASWAMMILGMGAIGYMLRRKVRVSEARFDAKIKRIAAGEAVA